MNAPTKQELKIEAAEALKKERELLYWLKEGEITPKQENNTQSIYHFIAPELVSPSPNTVGIKTLCITISEAATANTPQGKLLLANMLGRMKQSSPPNTEIGVRINPKTGEAEAFARGENLNSDDFRKKMQEICHFPISMDSVQPITSEDYKNPISLLSPKEQQVLIKNSQIALKVIENIPSNLNSLEAIKDYLQEKSEFLPNSAQHDKTKETALIFNRLKELGLKDSHCELNPKAHQTPIVKKNSIGRHQFFQ